MRKISRFFDMKRKGQPIAVLTGYDAPTAKAEEAAGVDIILVGDSVGTTMLGYASEERYPRRHVPPRRRRAPRRRPKTTIIADLPYRSYDTPEIAVESYASLLIAAGADIVKFEGARPEIVEALEGLDRSLLSPRASARTGHDDSLEAAEGGVAARSPTPITCSSAQQWQCVLEQLAYPEEADHVTRSIAAPTIGISTRRRPTGRCLLFPMCSASRPRTTITTGATRK